MKSLSYYRNDLTSWVELMFSLRSIEEFELFEGIIFNLEALYLSWKKDGSDVLDKKKLYELVDSC